MHNGDELCSEPGLDIVGNVLDSCGNGVSSSEQRVHNDAEVFNLEVGLIQSLERASIVEVVIERHDKVRICGSGDKSGVFGRGRE